MTTAKQRQWQSWYARNKAKRRRYMKEWRAANPQRVRDQNKKGWDAYRARDPGRVRALQSAWVLANPESVRASKRRWKENNRDKLNAYAAARKRTRRAYYTAIQNLRRYRAFSEWRRLPVKEKKRIEDVYEMCAIISAWTGTPHHVDHKRPLSKGGKHRLRNLQIMPSTMNLRKGAKYSRGRCPLS